MSGCTTHLPQFIMRVDQTPAPCSLFYQTHSVPLLPRFCLFSFWEISVSMGMTHLTSLVPSFFVLPVLVPISTTPFHPPIYPMAVPWTYHLELNSSLISYYITFFSFNDFPIHISGVIFLASPFPHYIGRWNPNTVSTRISFSTRLLSTAGESHRYSD